MRDSLTLGTCKDELRFCGIRICSSYACHGYQILDSHEPAYTRVWLRQKSVRYSTYTERNNSQLHPFCPLQSCWTCPYLRFPLPPPRDHRWKPSFQPGAWTHPASHHRGTGCRTSPRRTCFWEWPEGIESWASLGFQGPLRLIPFLKGSLFKKQNGNQACKGDQHSHTNIHSFVHPPIDLTIYWCWVPH